MTVRTTVSRRNVFTITDDAPTFTDKRKIARTVHVEITDYKGDLPLNPTPWLRIDTVQRREASDGRTFEDRTSVMLNASDRAALLNYLLQTTGK